MNNLDYILSPLAIRERCGEIYKFTKSGGSHFNLNEDKIPQCAEYVLKVMTENYPNLNIPFHSRWRHFKYLNITINHLSLIEQVKEKWSLVIPSVLLDAGAGMQWKYYDKEHKEYFSKSEGLALASLDMYKAGHFATAESLLKINADTIKKYFQVDDNNPLIGIDGRVTLLQNLGLALQKKSIAEIINDLVLDPPVKPGDDMLRRGNTVISATKVLRAVLDNFGEIWPGRLTLNSVNLGDVWRYSPLSNKEDFLVPFHKLSQWLTYSLLEPLMEAGIEIIDVEKLTGLSEYRNGGLFLDFGVIELKDPNLALVSHLPSEDLIIEWRALTICLLDKLGKIIQEKLNKTEKEFPLAKVLEGGTWWAGRKIAKSKREDGGPPLQLQSDGTVF